MIQRQGQVQATRYFTTLIGLLRDRSLFLEEFVPASSSRVR
jgi:hypothetical protein